MVLDNLVTCILVQVAGSNLAVFLPFSHPAVPERFRVSGRTDRLTVGTFRAISLSRGLLITHRPSAAHGSLTLFTHAIREPNSCFIYGLVAGSVQRSLQLPNAPHRRLWSLPHHKGPGSHPTCCRPTHHGTYLHRIGYDAQGSPGLMTF